MAQSTYEQVLYSLRADYEAASAEFQREFTAFQEGRQEWLVIKPIVEAFYQARESYLAFLMDGNGSPWESTHPEEETDAQLFARIPKSKGSGA
jgi:hypothetical protein